MAKPKTKKAKIDPNKRWKDNRIQFPRLLAEVNTLGLTEAQYQTLSESMDLDFQSIDDLFDRAEIEWTKIKQEV